MEANLGKHCDELASVEVGFKAREELVCQADCE